MSPPHGVGLQKGFLFLGQVPAAPSAFPLSFSAEHLPKLGQGEPGEAVRKARRLLSLWHHPVSWKTRPLGAPRLLPRPGPQAVAFPNTHPLNGARAPSDLDSEVASDVGKTGLRLAAPPRSQHTWQEEGGTLRPQGLGEEALLLKCNREIFHLSRDAQPVCLSAPGFLVTVKNGTSRKQTVLRVEAKHFVLCIGNTARN